MLWIDNGPVTMLTTIHNIDSKVSKERRRPRETSTNSKKIKSVFEGAARKILLIPKIIDDYNHHMGGVDIADQLRSYYSTQLTVCRTWPPLFFWLLDTSIINSYLICKKLGITKDHKSFRMDLIRVLIKDSAKNDNSFKRVTRSGKCDDDKQTDSIDVHENRSKKI